MILDTRALVAIAVEVRAGMDILNRRGLARVAGLMLVGEASYVLAT